jgi:putative colanic acid biosynthesis glycosyltransferase
MNKGIKRSNGVYVIFMNAGDIFCDDDILERIQNEIDEPLPDLIYGDALEENEQGTQYYKTARSHRLIHKGLFTHHQAMFYKRDKIGKMRFDLNYKYAGDYDFTARFLKKNPYAYYIEQPICIFESGGLSQTNAPQSRKEEFQIRKSLRVPFYKNIAVTMRQMITQMIRRLSPPLYWKIRESF